MLKNSPRRDGEPDPERELERERERDRDRDLKKLQSILMMKTKMKNQIIV